VADYKLIKIGRDRSNDILIEDASISRSHAEIFIDDEKNIFLTDLNSTYGTFVNGIRILEPVVLNTNDKVTLGDHIIIQYVKLLEDRYKFEDVVKFIDKRSWWVKNYDVLIIYLVDILLFLLILNI
jgi:pSer/pThr/pTyr-binding forkhead associated (FHA) protein